MPVIAAVLAGVLGWFVAGIVFWAVFTKLGLRFALLDDNEAGIRPVSLTRRDIQLRRFLINQRQRIAARN